jgi:RNA polymerase sigma-70 factor (ECF subfamily)
LRHPWRQSLAPRRPPLRLVGQADDGQPGDAALVRAFLAGEDWAAAAVWHRYAPMVYGVLDRALGSTSDSDDLTQEVFWRVFAAFGRIRDPDALRSFIYSAAIRILRWHLRTKRIRRILTLSDSGDLPDRGSPMTDNEGRELLERFYRLLDVLSANDRTAFVLRHIEGLSLEELAIATDASLATVKRRVHRASLQVTSLAKADPDLASYVLRSGGADES